MEWVKGCFKMTIFIVKLNHELKDFQLNNLPENRMDLVARCVNSALWLDHDIRRNVEVLFHFSNNKIVRIKGGDIRQMRPDERNITSFFKHILNGKRYPGIELTEMNFEDLLKLEKTEEMFILEKEGIDITKYTHGNLTQGAVFVLGDDVGLSNDYGLKKLRIVLRI